MSGCLICQRPGHLLDDELGVHPDLDVGARRRARRRPRRPAISPRVLGHVVGGRAQALAHARPAPPRSRRRAPRRRTRPGRDCRASRRRPRRPAGGSQAGLRGADQDPAALLAAQHLVRRGGPDAVQVDGVERQVAALAAAAHAGPRPRPRAGRAASRTGRAGRAGSSAATLARRLRGLSRPARRSRPGRRPAGRRPRRAARAARTARRPGVSRLLCARLPALHHVEHDLFQVGLPARQRGDLRLEVLQLPGGGDLAGVEPLRSRSTRALTCSTSASALPAPGRGRFSSASRAASSSRSSRSRALDPLGIPRSRAGVRRR